MSYQQIASKMRKTYVIQKNKKIRPFIPSTHWHSTNNVINVLNKFGSAFLKPDKGGGGGGAIKLIKQSNGTIICKSLKGSEVISSSQLDSWLSKRKLSTKGYIVQQGIDLAKIKGKPFDLRIHLQKPSRTWIISGAAAKVTTPGKIVTNRCKGGNPETLETILSHISSDSSKAAKLKKDLYDLSYEVAYTLNAHYKGLRELGIDIGLDKNLGIWIFEVNTRPSPKMFKELTNINMYRTIMRNKQQILRGIG